MNYVISLVSYIMDMLIVSVYLKSILKQRKESLKKYYFIALFMSEMLLYCNELIVSHYQYSNSILFTTLLSLLTTFFISLFYEAKFISRILAVVTFQVLVSVGESLFTLLVSLVNKNFFETDNTLLLYSVMNNGSKIILFIFCLMISVLWKRQENYPLEYSILLFSTPIISIIIYSIIPLKEIADSDNSLLYHSIFIGLLVINIVNYILINRTYDYIVFQTRNKQISEQLNFQKEKYAQLSESYKQTRRILHDTKKHYFAIQEFASENKPDQIITYMSDAINDLERTYAKYNTGNLVIDSLITNYENIALKHNIKFAVDLNVDSQRIPTSDYDLCIILGNILDNAINACLNSDNMYIFLEISTTDNDKFIIHSHNTISLELIKEDSAPFEHGYGLINIKNTVENNLGFMTYTLDDLFSIDILIPIVHKEKRIYT